jgi:uncharacterized phage-associated protein
MAAPWLYNTRQTREIQGSRMHSHKRSGLAACGTPAKCPPHDGARALHPQPLEEPMVPSFREDKATQAATLFLQWAGGRMNYMKLIKLLYLADRKALLAQGCPISFARPVSMKHGPVLSEVLDLVNEGSPPGTEAIWTRAISAPQNYQVQLSTPCPPDDLSDAEEEMLREVFEEYGALAPWPLVDHLHEVLPEWTETEGAVPIRYRDILRSEGWSEERIAELESELDDLAWIRRRAA